MTTSPVVIRRRSDGKYLTHWGAGIRRFGPTPAPFRSRGSAELVLRVDLGEDLADFEIIDTDSLHLKSVPDRNSFGGAR